MCGLEDSVWNVILYEMYDKELLAEAVHNIMFP